MDGDSLLIEGSHLTFFTTFFAATGKDALDSIMNLPTTPSATPTPTRTSLASPIPSPSATLVDLHTPRKHATNVEASPIERVFDIHDVLVNEYAHLPTDSQIG